MDTVVVCVVVVVVTVAWLVGQTIDIEPVDAEACFKACTVEPGKTPAWVDPVVFRDLKVQFYDWSKLDPTQWYRLRGAIDDYYDLFRQLRPKPQNAPTLDETILSLTVGKDAEREACIRVLLLMIYHPEIYNKYDRYAAYNAKVDELVTKKKV